MKDAVMDQLKKSVGDPGNELLMKEKQDGKLSIDLKNIEDEDAYIVIHCGNQKLLEDISRRVDKIRPRGMLAVLERAGVQFCFKPDQVQQANKVDDGILKTSFRSKLKEVLSEEEVNQLE